jgi:hypothetical protein
MDNYRFNERPQRNERSERNERPYKEYNYHSSRPEESPDNYRFRKNDNKRDYQQRQNSPRDYSNERDRREDRGRGRGGRGWTNRYNNYGFIERKVPMKEAKTKKGQSYYVRKDNPEEGEK